MIIILGISNVFAVPLAVSSIDCATHIGMAIHVGPLILSIEWRRPA